MDRIRALVDQVKDFFGGRRAKAELEEEFDFHLAMETEANLRAGMEPEEARSQALASFGSRDWHGERVREERGGAVAEDLVRDARFGFRVLRRRPVFALAAVLTLSVGVGMTTTMFTVMDAVVIRPLPGSRTAGMVYLWLMSADGDAWRSPSPEFLRLVRDHASSFSQIEAYSTGDYSVEVAGEPLRVGGAMASAGFFNFLGIRPQLGRLFHAGDGTGSGNPVVVLNHNFWVERFGERPEAVGEPMVIDGLTYEIVGVLPRDFRVDARTEAAFWLPEGATGELFGDGAPLEAALATLSDGVSREAASAELDAIVQNNPLSRRADLDWTGKIQTPEELVDPDLRKALLILQAGAVLVLLIACANLTNLLLAQGEVRARELAVRSSMGAGRGRLIRQLLAESLVLGVLGGMGGLVLTAWALDSLPLFLPSGYSGLRVNGAALLFAAAATLAAVLGAGLFPALQGSKRELSEIMKGATGPGKHRGLLRRLGVRQVLVTVQVALAFVLLVPAGLLLKSLSGLTDYDVGFPRDNLMTMRVELPEEGYGSEALQLAFYQGLRNGIRDGFPAALGSATVASGLVGDLSAMIGVLAADGEPAGEDAERRVLLTWSVAPDYFQVLGIPLSQGRAFREDEARAGGENVVILNEEIGRQYFPDGDAVGRLLMIDDEGYRVVGVAGSVNLPELATSSLKEMQLFFPFSQNISDGFTLIARVRGDRTAAAERLKETVWALDRSLPVQDISMLEDALAESLSQERSNTLLMIIFGLTSLLLGALGIYGVMAYSVSRRIREMGIRLALGASRRGVVRRVILGGMGGVVLGMGLGALVAVILGSTISDLLVDVDPRDPGVFLAVVVVTGVVALIATWVPARKAAGSGPLDALRSD